MVSVVRTGLLVLLVALLVGALTGIFAGGTGPLEKLVFVLAAGAIVFAAARVRRMGSHPAA